MSAERQIRPCVGLMVVWLYISRASAVPNFDSRFFIESSGGDLQTAIATYYETDGETITEDGEQLPLPTSSSGKCQTRSQG